MKKKMFAALALSATLAMGAVPAFAADDGTAVGENKNLDTDNKATTTVSVKTTVGQISAAIPVTATIVASMDGGAILAPSAAADGYRIENNSIFSIKVTGAEAKAGTGWELKNASIAESTLPATASMGDIYLTLQPGSDGSATAWNCGETFATGDSWVVPASADGKAAGVLPLQLAGNTSKLKQAYENNTTVDAVVITYTIGATPAPEKTPGA